MEAEAASLEAMQYYHTVRAASGSRGDAENPFCRMFTCIIDQSLTGFFGVLSSLVFGHASVQEAVPRVVTS